MKPLDVLTALDAAGDRASESDWISLVDTVYNRLGIVVFDAPRTAAGRADVRFAVAAANARPALKSHLAAVSRLVAAARGALACLDAWRDVMSPDGEATEIDALRDALKEVTS